MLRLEGEQLRFARRRNKGWFVVAAFFGGGMRFNLSLLRFLSFSLFLTFSRNNGSSSVGPWHHCGTVAR